ncbi:MAG: uracil-DNA glycosylase [Candidatus Thermoplasmatota archaeon]|nr:uracil-DNA glycosylase [Candidatus Thermoplasmatota archaeon]
MESLSDLCTEILNCKACDLSYSRKKAVCGTGVSGARIMVVGEAPGSKEDAVGLPFVGRSGVLLDKALRTAGLQRSDLYVTNSVRCKPPVGKSPKIEHIRSCSNFLKREIAAVSPAIIVPMGNSALIAVAGILGFNTGKITEMSGRMLKFRDYLIIPQFHPAAILRNPKRMAEFQENFILISDASKDIADHETSWLTTKYKIEEIENQS